MADAAKDLASGTVGGAAQIIVGHPFDTIKVKLQSQPAPTPGQPPRYTGAFDAVRQTVAAEGPKGLYKGMGAPLATVAALNAVLFTVRGQMEGLLRSDLGVPLTISQQFVCGSGAGFAVSFLACPTELVKCRSGSFANHPGLDVSLCVCSLLFRYQVASTRCTSLRLYHKLSRCSREIRWTNGRSPSCATIRRRSTRAIQRFVPYVCPRNPRKRNNVCHLRSFQAVLSRWF